MARFSGCGLKVDENLPAAKLFWYRQRLRAPSANLNRGFFSRIRIESPTPNPLTQRVDGRGADFNENSFPLGRVTPVEDFQHLATVASTDVSEHIL